MSRPSILTRSIRDNTKSRPSTLGEEINFPVNFSNLKKNNSNEYKKGIGLSLTKPSETNTIRTQMSMFFKTKKDSFMIPKQNINIFMDKSESYIEKNMEKQNDLKRNNKDNNFLMRYIQITKEKKVKTVDSSENKDNIKRRINTAYIINYKNEVEKAQNSKKELLFKKKVRRIRKKNDEESKKEGYFPFKDNQFKSQIVEKRWTGPLLKEYKKELKLRIKSMGKELSNYCN